jgi:hypothetical protein
MRNVRGEYFAPVGYGIAEGSGFRTGSVSYRLQEYQFIVNESSVSCVEVQPIRNSGEEPAPIMRVPKNSFAQIYNDDHAESAGSKGFRNQDPSKCRIVNPIHSVNTLTQMRRRSNEKFLRGLTFICWVGIDDDSWAGYDEISHGLERLGGRLLHNWAAPKGFAFSNTTTIKEWEDS